MTQVNEVEMTVDEFLAHYGTVAEEALAHYGVLGMKWGHHKAQTDSSGAPVKTRKELRAIDKAAKAADKKAHTAEVDAARERYNTSARKNYLDAKKQYKIDKAVMGKYEANKIFQQVQDKNVADFQKASEYRDGKEKAKVILTVVGMSVLYGALAASLKNPPRY